VTEQKPAIRPIVLVGDQNLSSAVDEVRLKMAIGELASTRITLKTAALKIQSINWRSRVNISFIQDGVEYQQFSGNIRSVHHSPSRITIECISGIELLEMAGRKAIYNCGKDLMHATVRASGIAEDSIDIEGLGNNPVELMDVTVAVRAVTLSNIEQFGSVTLLPREHIEAIIDSRGNYAILDTFRAARAFAHVTVGPLQRLYDAETAGLEKIDTVLAYIRAKSRYSFATLPDGTVPNWSRTDSLARVKRGPIAMVRARETGREWVRDTTYSQMENALNLSNEYLYPHNPGISGEESDLTKQFILAMSRAIDDTNITSKVSAIWEAIEFYAGATQIDNIFTKDELKSIGQSLSKDLTVDQRSRLQNLIGTLNNPPLLTKFRRQIEIDGVPVTESEFLDLRTARQIRNDAAHGKIVSTPSLEAIDRTISVIVRVLMYHLKNSSIKPRLGN
jgi:hypothetical protein